MKKIIVWFYSLSNRLRDSISCSVFIVGLISTVCTILGFSLADIKFLSAWGRVCTVLVTAIVIAYIVYKAIGCVYKEKIDLVVNQTPVDIICGDIFNTNGWKVIVNIPVR